MNKLLASLAIALIAYYFISNQPKTTQVTLKADAKIQPILLSPTHKPDEIFVKRVIDGDTIVLNTGEKVRYIGVNTPELTNKSKQADCFAIESFQANSDLVMNKVVRLEKDVSNTDKYNRLLRYVYVADPSYVYTPGVKAKEIFVNDYLVKYGYAQVATYPPDVKYQKIFLASQKEAKQKLTGLWKTCERNKQ